jgi:nicotinamide-nucleotide amidase
MRSFVLTIGSELTSGDKPNGNSVYLANRLTALGVPPLHIHSVPDDPLAIASVLKWALEECEIVVLTGGLGPTVDDVTREAVAASFGLPLIENEEIEAILADKIPHPTEGQFRQIRLPQGAHFYPPELGTAPGFKLEVDQKNIFVLPGVPEEMKKMFEDYIAPELKNFIGEPGLKYQTYKFCGIGEVVVEGKLKEIPEFAGLIVDYSILPHGMEVHLKISSDKESLAFLDEKVKEIFGDELFSIGDKTLAEVTGENLRNGRLTVSTVESCTGGLLAKMLTDAPGSSDYFTGSIVAYGNDVKGHLVNVSLEIIKEFGAVSSQCAEAMAGNGRQVLKTDLCLSITGIAGPSGGTEEKPVGLVWFGLADKDGVESDFVQFSGDRSGIRLRAAQTGLNILRLKAKT